jgi:DNA-binding NtrC family response regulator
MLEDGGHTVEEAESGDQALQFLAERRMDVVLLDLDMPGLHGLDALVKIRELAPDTGVIVVTGHGTTGNAFKAAQRGAFDFINKPVGDPHVVGPGGTTPEHLLGAIEQAASLTRMRRGSAVPARAEEAESGADLGMVGASPALEALMEKVRRVAPSQGRVLITGENGSGKELIAHAIHNLSKRSEGPFIKLNCAAIPKDLVESELFGYERGAFTSAVQAKKGRLELADGGTLFLDEIGDLSLEAQAKLLRVVETGEFERVGGTRTQTCDVRIVAATNKDLTAARGSGDFREDLFHRLNVLPLHVPALRERRTDVTLLAAHFLALACDAEGKPAKRLTDEARKVLEDYAWPGNVRELRNLMERAAILVDGDAVRAEDLAMWLEPAAAAEEGVGLRGEIERREADAIRRALEGADWNVTQAAAGLGIDRTNLHRKMRKYGIARR